MDLAEPWLWHQEYRAVISGLRFLKCLRLVLLFLRVGLMWWMTELYLLFGLVCGLFALVCVLFALAVRERELWELIYASPPIFVECYRGAQGKRSSNSFMLERNVLFNVRVPRS